VGDNSRLDAYSNKYGNSVRKKGNLVQEVNNEKGEDYEPESLKVMMASLDRHLKEQRLHPVHCT